MVILVRLSTLIYHLVSSSYTNRNNHYGRINNVSAFLNLVVSTQTWQTQIAIQS